MISDTSGSSSTSSKPGRNGFRCSSPLATLTTAPPLSPASKNARGGDSAFEIDSASLKRLRPVIGKTNRLTVREQGKVSRVKDRLALLPKRLGSADGSASPASAARERRDFGPAAGLADRVGGFDLRHLPA